VVMDEYEGEVSSDLKRHGKGVFKSAKGDVFEGDFERNHITGKGVYKYKNGDIFRGEFMNGIKNGFGVFYSAKDQSYFEGVWRDNEKSGKGVLHLVSGEKEEAFWKGDKPIGKVLKK